MKDTNLNIIINERSICYNSFLNVCLVTLRFLQSLYRSKHEAFMTWSFFTSICWTIILTWSTIKIWISKLSRFYRLAVSNTITNILVNLRISSYFTTSNNSSYIHHSFITRTQVPESLTRIVYIYSSEFTYIRLTELEKEPVPSIMAKSNFSDLKSVNSKPNCRIHTTWLQTGIHTVTVHTGWRKYKYYHVTATL